MYRYMRAERAYQGGGALLLLGREGEERVFAVERERVHLLLEPLPLLRIGSLA